METAEYQVKRLRTLRDLNRHRPGAFTKDLVDALLVAVKAPLDQGRLADAVEVAAEALAVYDGEVARAPDVARQMHEELVRKLYGELARRQTAVAQGQVAKVPDPQLDLRNILVLQLASSLAMRAASEAAPGENGGLLRSCAAFDEALVHFRAVHRNQPQNVQFRGRFLTCLNSGIQLSDEVVLTIEQAQKVVTYVDESLQLLEDADEVGVEEDDDDLAGEETTTSPAAVRDRRYAKLMVARARLILYSHQFAEAHAVAIKALKLVRRASPASAKPGRWRATLQGRALVVMAHASFILQNVVEALAESADAFEMYRSVGGRDGERLKGLDRYNFVNLLCVAANAELERGSFFAGLAAARAAADANRAARTKLMPKFFADNMIKLARWILLAAAGPDDVDTAVALVDEVEVALIHNDLWYADSRNFTGPDTVGRAKLVKRAALACGKDAPPEVVALVAAARAAASAVPRAHAFHVLTWTLAENVVSLGTSDSAYPLVVLIVENLMDVGQTVAHGVAAATSREADWSEVAPRACLFAAECSEARGATGDANLFREAAAAHRKQEL